jgi:hypothetical protein
VWTKSKRRPPGAVHAPGGDRFHQVPVGAADVQEGAVPVDRLADLRAARAPRRRRAAEPGASLRGALAQVRRLHQALPVAVEGPVVQAAPGQVGGLHDRRGTLVTGGAQAAGGLGGVPLPQRHLGVGARAAVAVVALAPQVEMVAVGRQLVEGLAAEPGGRQRHAQSRVQQRILAREHLA